MKIVPRLFRTATPSAGWTDRRTPGPAPRRPGPSGVALGLAVLLSAGCAAPGDAPAQADEVQVGTDAQTMIDHLLTQSDEVRDKLMGLAQAIPEEDYATVQAYEGRTATKAEIIAELEASFDHLAAAVAQSRGDLDAEFQAFGSDFTGGSLWTLAVTHLHEHLGQAIAYARSNEVVPPWSQ